jgi:hypothetical protein
MSFTVGNHVGRLLEVRVVPPVTLEEATRFLQEIVRLTGAVSSKIVACTDLRGATRATDPEMIDFIAGVIRSENPRLERNALIVPVRSPTFALQMERLVKSAGTAQRRIFKTRGEAETWLGEVLTGGERARLRTFLDEHRDGGGA